MRNSTFASALALLLGSSMTAQAQPTVIRTSATIRTSSSIEDGAARLAPLAFVRFCMTYAQDCVDDDNRSVVSLTSEAWATIQAVNLDVNRAIKPRSDLDDDSWDLGRSEGDCDDYAVEKRHRLLAAGFPLAALSLTEVVANGEGHLVLTVRTDRGDFVLDNLRRAVLPWKTTGYRFVKMQSFQQPMFWVAINEAKPPMLLAELRLRGPLTIAD